MFHLIDNDNRIVSYSCSTETEAQREYLRLKKVRRDIDALDDPTVSALWQQGKREGYSVRFLHGTWPIGERAPQ